MDDSYIGVQRYRADDLCTIDSMSEELRERLGYTKEELFEQFGNSYYALIYKEDGPKVRSKLGALKEEEHYVIDYRLLCKNGELLWVHEQGWRAGQYYYCRIEDASRYYDLDSYYRNVLDSLPTQVLISDLNKKILFVNKMFCEANGLLAGECEGRGCDELPTCPLRMGMDCCIERLARGEAYTKMENSKTGQAYRLCLSYLYNKEGNKSGYISVGTDVTELKKVEEELRLSEEKYRVAINQSKDLIWEYDLATRSAHQAENPLAGYPDEIVTDVPESYIRRGKVCPESEEALREMYRAIHRGDCTAECRVQLLGAGGKRFFAHLTCTTIFDGKGRPVRAIGVCRDITQQVVLEQRYRNEREYRDTLTSGAMSTYEVDLTEDTVKYLDATWVDSLGLEQEARYSYSRLVQSASEKVVSQEHREKMRQVFEPQNLLAAYQAGKREMECEYRRANREGKMVWVRSVAYLAALEPEGHIGAFIFIKDIDQQKQKELELKNKAERDLLTGLYNRMTAKAKIDRALRQAHPRSSALFMLDIDNFKQINDTYGHTYGDAVLSELASKLEKIFRQHDLLSRLGGDEFLVFLEDIPEELAFSKAQQICEQLRTVYSSSGRYCEISCSVGIAFAPRHGSCFEELYEKADTALYHSKDQGKNRYSVYQDGLTKINPGLRQPAEAGALVGKVFSQNIVEYIFKILYYSQDLELAVTSVLELLCKHYNASRGYFIEYSAQKQSYSMRFEWCAPGLRPSKDEVVNISEEQIGNVQSNMTEGGIFAIEDMEKAEPDLAKAAFVRGARAMLCCGLAVGGEYMGIIGVEDHNGKRSFTAEEQNALQSAAEIIGVFLHSKRSEQQRENYSTAMQTVLDNVRSASYVIDPKDYRLIYRNRATIETFPDSQVGQRCYACFRGLDAPCPSCPLQELAPQMDAEHTMELYDQEHHRWIDISANWVRWPDGGKYCMINCNDITRYK